MQDEYITQADVPSAGENGDASRSAGDLQTQLAAETARADDNYNKFLLAMADFENYKKRMERSYRELSTAGERKMLLQFLPVLDNFERALTYSGENAEALRSGLQNTLRQFENVLSMASVKPIDVKGKPFDPAIAEAIGTQTADGVEDDTVLEEAQRGYTIGDELLRPAKVIVAKRAPE
ncbi:MAG TPA: nucleotide exchange factor GrpE [Candidatus Baltobacteraceae bacterium]|jgi:molecular chaperone GrpE|nr:nucleotide exchange factor GrpE [Candidatus Baltobacteraceae bacterium]